MKKYVISTLITGNNSNDKFLASLKFYCNKHNATLLLIPTNIDKLNDKQKNNSSIIKSSVNLNRNLMLSVLPLNPEQVDPITGLDRLTSIHKSVIYGSPKQRLKSVANPSETLPRVIMTPGSVSHPSTKNTKRALIANRDHVYGAIVVEVNKHYYNFRQVQADRHGSFIDLGVEYSNNSTKKAALEALIPGDYHAGFTDPKVKSIILSVMKKYSPKYLILHDFFDGISINHHIEHKYITRARLNQLNNLENELKFAAKELKELSTKVKNVSIVKSNHDEFLDRWLEEGKYVQDPTNHIIGLELALAKAMGQDPLAYGIGKFNKSLNNVEFLKTDSSKKVTNKKIELASHGHRGANGSRGSSGNLEKCYQNIVYGHSHSPEILRNAWVVGTSTYLRLNYNTGPSSWMQTMCLVYANGSRQLINVIDGKATI